MSLPAPIVIPPSERWDGNDGLWSTFTINVGTPGQGFRVLMSTTASSIYLPVAGVCPGYAPSDCLDSHGLLPFRERNGLGFQSSQSTSWQPIGNYESAFYANLNLSFNVSYGSDTVRLGPPSNSSAFTMADQNVGTYLDARFWLGFFGLSAASEFFGSMRKPFESFFGSLNQSSIPSYSYSYGAGAAYRNKTLFASFILSGYDTTRFEESDMTFSLRNTKHELTLGVLAITSTNTLKGDFGLTSVGFLSAIDSTVSQIWLPDNVCDTFVEAFNLKYDNSTELFLVDDVTHERLQELNPQFTFRLGSHAEDKGHFVNIVLPYAAFDLQASYPIYRKPTNYFPIRRASNADSFILGRAFLQEAYLIVNYGDRSFSVNQAVYPNPMPAPKVVPIYSPGYSPSGQGLSRGTMQPGSAKDVRNRGRRELVRDARRAVTRTGGSRRPQGYFPTNDRIIRLITCLRIQHADGTAHNRGDHP